MKYRGTEIDDKLVKEVFRLRRIGDVCFTVGLAALCFFLWHYWILAASMCVFSLIALTTHVFTERGRGERIFTGIFYVVLLVVVITGSARVYLDLGLVSPDGPPDQLPQRVTSYADALYFSIITCTTTGYGDIRPLPAARAWAAGEALFGFFHLGLLVAYITANLQRHSSTHEPTPNETGTPNHALQRTAPHVTAPASTAAFPPTMQVPRRAPRSLSLGSLGVATVSPVQRSRIHIMPQNSIPNLAAENARLQKENTRLKEELTLLNEQLAFHKRHSRNQTAKLGEEYIRTLLGGEFSIHNAAHDIVVGKIRFEVKASACSSVDNKKPLCATRWTWHRILGNTGQKDYDRLILLGKVDERHRAKYLDPDFTPYVIFDVPFEQAKSLLSNTTPPFINVTTNPDSQRTSKGELLWGFQITSEDLKERYTLRKQNSKNKSRNA